MLRTDIDTTEELIAIALEAEREAIRRYSALAVSMHEHGNEEAAALFERMVDEEVGHEKLLVEWAEQGGLDINIDVGPIKWEDPVVATIYDDEARDPDQSTSYKALAFAVHNEERAFHFYSYVAADSKDPDVRAYAEILAQEELGHAALLRAMRRRAWHANRHQHNSQPNIDPASIHGGPDLLVASVCIEQFLADLMDIAAADFPNLKTLAVSTRDFITSSEKTLHHGESPGAEIAEVLIPVIAWSKQTLEATDSTSAALRQLCADSDRSFSFYDSVVVSAQDEAVMLMAQHLSSHALERIGGLRELIGDSCTHGDN